MNRSPYLLRTSRCQLSMALRMAAALPKIDALPAALISSDLQPSSRPLCALTGTASSAVMSRATVVLAAQHTLYLRQNLLQPSTPDDRGNQICPSVATTTRAVGPLREANAPPLAPRRIRACAAKSLGGVRHRPRG